MKVYVVEYGSYDGGSVRGVFSTFDKAHDFVINLCEEQVKDYKKLWSKDELYLEDAGYSKDGPTPRPSFYNGEIMCSYTVNKHDSALITEMEVE